MMPRIWLGVLYLSGWYISSCLLQKFVYVAEPKTWNESQAYCREKHADLATITNLEEKNQLIETSSGSEVWIGLSSQVEWKWSDGSEAEKPNWSTADGEPNFHYHGELCGQWHGKKLLDSHCGGETTFICNRGTPLNPDLVFVDLGKNWADAQKYCREHFTDLATVKNPTQDQQIHDMVPSGGYIWIGLYRDFNAIWSDGRNYSFSYGWWTGDYIPLGSMSVLCAASQTSGLWKMKSCKAKLPFVCYNTPVGRQVIKLSIKPDDSSVDLNDPAVNANLLKKIQDRLMERGLSGVTLKWREQPDGKVFHKEGKPKKKKKLCKTEL